MLTLQAHLPGDAEIVLFTDRPWMYRWFRASIVVEQLGTATLREWRGPADDRFRPKIEALRRLASDGGADVVLVDADTMAREPLTPLADHLARGGLVLHKREYLVADAKRKGDRRLPREILGRTWGGVLAGRDTWMWNGGVVGSSKQHGAVFDTVLVAFDEMRAVSAHFALEQLAYSIVFPAYGSVVEADRWVAHYWANRATFDRSIERFLSGALLEQLDPPCAAERLHRSPIIGALDARLPWWRRRLRRLLKFDNADAEESSA